MYNIKDNCLYINGTLGSTAEIIIEDQYLLSILLKDRLGYRLANHLITINGSKYSSDSSGYVKAYLVPEDYLLDFPTYRGFEFYRVDSTTATPLHIVLTTDKSLTTEYLVPSAFSNVAGRTLYSYWRYVYDKIRNFFARLFGQEETISGYVEGYLKDYYGNGVPNRVVTVNITNLDTGYTVTLTATTDPSGYFRTDYFDFARGVEYEIKTFFEGDDIYTESTGVTKWTAPAVAPAPAPAPAVTWYYWVALALILLVILGIAIAVRVSRAVSLRPRRYLKLGS